MTPDSPDSFRDRLSMISENGSRMKIYVAEVKGYFQRRREVVHFGLILFFMILPWTKIKGVQSLLLDLPQRRFAIFGLVFQAHDGPLLFFVFGSLAVALAFVTAVWGRVWCGWACPQTVFLDGVYRRIERFFEGGHLQRRALDAAPASWNRFFRKSGKWLVFIVVSTLLTHSFLAYFVGSDRLIAMIQGPPGENWASFVFILGSTLIILLNFGWFREQFCIVACPYGRFQSVLMDTQTLTVAYDFTRGEPRKGTAAPNAVRKGDCVACGRCVQVCPTGIDIRNGLQMECIGCTACIDACDEIMVKVKKPTGLIKYASLRPRSVWFKRPRAMAYFTVLMMMVLGLSTAIVTRENFSAQLLRGLESPYTLTTDANGETWVVNHMRLHLHSQISVEQELTIELTSVEIANGLQLKMPQETVRLAPHGHMELHLFLSKRRAQKIANLPIQIRVRAKDSSAQLVKGVFLGPY